MEMENLEKKFKEEMDDDFNTAGATGVVFEYVRLVNTYMKGSATLDRSVLSRAHKFFEDFDNIFGVIGITSIQEEAEDQIEKMIQMREKARKSRDFSKADAIRDELLEKGIVIEDTPHGPKWKKKL